MGKRGQQAIDAVILQGLKLDRVLPAAFCRDVMHLANDRARC